MQAIWINSWVVTKEVILLESLKFDCCVPENMTEMENGKKEKL